MPLTNAEYARLDKARVNELAMPRRVPPDIVRLALEHTNDMQEQQAKALTIIEILVEGRNKSWCYRVPRFFKVLYARAMLWL